MIKESIQQCLNLKLIQLTESNKLIPTDLGKICASKKISLETYVLLRDWLSTSLPINEFTTIYFAVQAKELSQISFTMSTSEFYSNSYINYIRETHEDLGISADILNQIGQYNQPQIGYEKTKQLKMALLANMWIEGHEYQELEEVFRVNAGPIKNVSEHLAWIVNSAAKAAPFLGRNKQEADTLSTISERLQYGVPTDLVSIARLRVPGINRTEMMRLLEHGFNTPDKILDADLADFQGVISKKTATSLQEHIQTSIRDGLARQKRGQILRLQKLGLDTAVLNALYDQAGTALEVTLCDVFVPPFCSLVFERITKQREGEPDNLLHLSNGEVIAFSVTARENHNVSMKKASEILAGAAAFKPVARIVIGRPDFHELAIKKANEIVAEGINFKLIPIHVLAEMYIRVYEGKLNEDQVLNVLRDEQGYITYDSLKRYSLGK